MTQSSYGRKSIAVVAGVPSGDWIAATAVRELSKIHSDIRCFGIGGDEMKAAGVELVQHISTMTALGPLESLKRAPRWMNAFAALRLRCREERPLAALLVDCPDINLPLARGLKADGVRVLQYMGPKVWVWRKDRLALLRERTDMVALGFAFEKPLYDEWRVPSVFVGHPLLDAPPPSNRESVRRVLHVPSGGRVVALLPGSRRSELKYLGPPLLETGVRLLKDGITPVFAPFAGAAPREMLDRARSLGCVIWDGPVRSLLCGCDGALVASGTVTLELALAGVPMAIIYKMDGPGFWLGKKLLDIEWVGLPNWVAGRRIVPELLQDAVTAENLYNAARHLLTPAETTRQTRDLKEVALKMGTGGAAHRVAGMLAAWLM